MSSLSLTKYWTYWSEVPFIGKWIFSWIVSFVTPYTGTIPFRIQRLSGVEGECKTDLYDSWFNHNPFGTIHAAALINFGEVTQGMASFAWSEQNKYRCIPSKLEGVFLKKAKGSLKGVCKLPDTLLNRSASSLESMEVSIVTEIIDRQGDLVAKVTGLWNFKPITNRNNKIE